MKIKDMEKARQLYNQLSDIRETMEYNRFCIAPSVGTYKTYKCPIPKEKALEFFKQKEQEILDELKELGVEIDE